MSSPLESITLFAGRSATLRHVVCRHGRGGPGDEEGSDALGIGFPTAGVFRRHGPRGEVLADPGLAVVFEPGEPYRVSHPVEGGDATTVLEFSRRAVRDAVARRDPRGPERGGEPAPVFPAQTFPVPAAGFALVARLRRLGTEAGGREIEIEEGALAVLDACVALSRGGRLSPPAGRRPDAAALRRRRADAVREVLSVRLAERLTLDTIAREVAVSPFHLARSFRDEVGLPIHRYLNRLRLRRALDRIAGGAGDLGAIALGCGFSSHAHFTDAFRREFGLPPSRFRAPASPREIRALRKDLEARGRSRPVR